MKKLVLTMTRTDLRPEALERYKAQLSKELGGIDVVILAGVSSAVLVEVPE